VKKYLQFINEKVGKEIKINSENDFHLIKEGVELIDASYAKLSYFPTLPKSLKELYCSANNLKSLPELPENLILLSCYDNNLKIIPELPKKLERLYCGNNNLSHLPELPNSLTQLYCNGNKLEYLPKLPNSLTKLCCNENELTSLPELPESLLESSCWNNPLEYPIPHKFYKDQDEDWLKKLNIKLSTYEHQKQLIEKNGIYIMKKYENHSELINEKIKEENPTYFLSVEYGF